MKKPIRTHESSSPEPMRLSAFSRIFWRFTECFAWLLTVLLPIKFASFVSAPEAGALYWTDPVSLAVISWPLPVFMMAAPILLLLALCSGLMRRDMALCPSLVKYAALWCVLGGVSVLGLVNASCLGYAPQMIAHTLSLACYAASLAILLSGRREFAKSLTGALVLGGVLSLASGMYQYWCGFDALREHVEARAAATGHAVVNENMAIRIGEARIQADFNACNVYGAYLAALLPFLTVLFWRFGNERVTPPKLSRRLFGGIVFVVTAFLLVKTDSRGAVFSLLAACAAVFFFSGLPRKWKIAGAAVLLAGVAGLAAMFAFGRGALSIFVRFDYVQSAARQMLNHPLAGTGWGDFLHDHMIFRLWRDKEAAHSPHNMVMLFGSQCGVAGFLAALAVLAYPVVEACRQIRRTDWRSSKDFFALVPAFSCLILSVGTLLDIGFETTAYSGVMIAFSLLVLMRDAPQSGPFVCRKPAHCVAVALTLLFGVVSFVVSYRYFQAEKAFSALTSELNPEYSFEHQDEPDYVAPFNRVQTLLREAVIAAPGSPFPWDAAADYMTCSGRFKEAMTCIDRAIELDPLQSAHYIKRARIRFARDLVLRNAMGIGGVSATPGLDPLQYAYGKRARISYARDLVLRNAIRIRIGGMSATPEESRDLATARRLAPKNPELNRPDVEILAAPFTPKEPQP